MPIFDRLWQIFSNSSSREISFFCLCGAFCNPIVPAVVLGKSTTAAENMHTQIVQTDYLIIYSNIVCPRPVPQNFCSIVLTKLYQGVYCCTRHKNRGAEGHPRLRSKQTAASGRLEPDPDNAGVGSLTPPMCHTAFAPAVFAGAFLVFMYFLSLGRSIYP